MLILMSPHDNNEMSPHANNEMSPYDNNEMSPHDSNEMSPHANNPEFLPLTGGHNYHEHTLYLVA